MLNLIRSSTGQCVGEKFVAIERSDGGGGLQEWVHENRRPLKELLAAFGGILFRGFEIDQQSSFEEALSALSSKPVEYIYRSTPRQQLGAGIYTATEYPKEQEIPLHNENAYQRDWPMRILFCCMRPAEAGGETPLASTAAITERIDRDVFDKFAERKVMYVRNYSSNVDLPWETVFQTGDKEKVEEYCRAHDIEFEWRPRNGLRTRQVCQAIATHPQTGQRVWFNQAHLFHVSSLEPRVRAAMLKLFKEDELPRSSFYGDGSPIEDGVLEHIRAAYEAEKVYFSWEKGDLLLLDNMLACHGRRKYRGARKILTAMADMFSEQGGKNEV